MFVILLGTSTSYWLPVIQKLPQFRTIMIMSDSDSVNDFKSIREPELILSDIDDLKVSPASLILMVKKYFKKAILIALTLNKSEVVTNRLLKVGFDHVLHKDTSLIEKIRETLKTYP